MGANTPALKGHQSLPLQVGIHRLMDSVNSIHSKVTAPNSGLVGDDIELEAFGSKQREGLEGIREIFNVRDSRQIILVANECAIAV